MVLCSFEVKILHLALRIHKSSILPVTMFTSLCICSFEYLHRLTCWLRLAQIFSLLSPSVPSECKALLWTTPTTCSIRLVSVLCCFFLRLNSKDPLHASLQGPELKWECRSSSLLLHEYVVSLLVSCHCPLVSNFAAPGLWWPSSVPVHVFQMPAVLFR